MTTTPTNESETLDFVLAFGPETYRRLVERARERDRDPEQVIAEAVGELLRDASAGKDIAQERRAGPVAR